MDHEDVDRRRDVGVDRRAPSGISPLATVFRWQKRWKVPKIGVDAFSMGYFESDYQTLLADPVTERDHVRGPASAAVTLVEYGDFACQYSAAAYGTVRTLLDQFADLRLVFRANPRSHFFPHAAEAAEATEAAGAQGKYWEMHDRLFENQATFSSDELRRQAKAIGLDMDRFERDLKTGAFREAVHRQEISGWHSHVRFDDAPSALTAALARARAKGNKYGASQMYREATVQSGDDGFRQIITIGPHELTSDLPAEEDGGETGPSPHDLLLAALGSCTAMTIKWLAKKERLPLQHVEVRLSQSRSGEGHLLRLSIELVGDLSEAQRAALLAAAESCPVSRTLSGRIRVETRLGNDRTADEAGEESFPASDPPSWTLGR
jgi:uncharacterized OsmC-like protein